MLYKHINSATLQAAEDRRQRVEVRGEGGKIKIVGSLLDNFLFFLVIPTKPAPYLMGAPSQISPFIQSSTHKEVEKK